MDLFAKFGWDTREGYEPEMGAESSWQVERTFVAGGENVAVASESDYVVSSGGSKITVTSSAKSSTSSISDRVPSSRSGLLAIRSTGLDETDNSYTADATEINETGSDRQMLGSSVRNLDFTVFGVACLLLAVGALLRSLKRRCDQAHWLAAQQGLRERLL
jgi:hypothetical protein